MKKIKFLFIALIIIFSLFYSRTVIYADETEAEAEDNVISEKEEIRNILSLIEGYLSQINTKINQLDKKIEYAKIQKEFEYYPAIRLNVDTPMFGLTSIVENKLRVKKDISTSDVASNYSIRYIVNNKKIRIPDTYLGSIVMSTKEYNIDEKITLSQAKLTLVKCIQYLSQVNSVNEFMDTQINNIFRDYINDTKKTSIRDIKDRIRRVSSKLVEISDNLTKLELLGIDTSEYKNTYIDLSKELYNINITSKNTLILDTDLNNLVKNSLNNESKVIDFETKISEIYENSLENINYELFLNNLRAKYKTKFEEMKLYINNSTKVVQNSDKEEKITTVNYNVTSAATLDYMKLTLEDINSKIVTNEKEIEDKNNNKENEADNIEKKDEEKNQDQINQEKQIKIEENEKKINTLYIKYKEVLSREYKFYTSNINMLLKDSNDKISSIIGEIDSGIKIDNEIFNYTKYIYIDLPDNLQKYISENSLDSTIELNNLINALKTELKTLCSKNMEIVKLYDRIIKEVLNS